MYLTPELERGFVWSYAAVPLLISFVSSVGVAMIKSMSVSREKAANLLRPPLPKSGQRILLERIPMIWDRLSFLYKVSLRNLFRNKNALCDDRCRNWRLLWAPNYGIWY
ncbi:hypothetical protein [Erysipelothrix piscisicarius]|uniref:hypothetical protein n=1 Tax=Erysipelothrix piscisicarius TaxID=2485784 RepID=UPI002F91F3A8